MELKNYQKAVIRDLERYLEILMQTKNIETAYTRLWQEKDVKVGFGGMPKYQNLLPGVPNVCLKVPTGGGKTFLAANAIEPIFSALGVVKRRAVVWLVPSDAILTQTLAALRDPAHPYRQKIDVAFGSRVEVYTKEQLLMGQHFNISAVNEQLSIMVLSYDSFRNLSGAQPPSPGVQHGAAYGRGHAAPSCRLYPGSNGADEGTVNESVYEAGAQAAGLYRCWSETDRVEGLDGSGEGSADGDRSAA